MWLDRLKASLVPADHVHRVGSHVYVGWYRHTCTLHNQQYFNWNVSLTTYGGSSDEHEYIGMRPLLCDTYTGPELLVSYIARDFICMGHSVLCMDCIPTLSLFLKMWPTLGVYTLKYLCDHTMIPDGFNHQISFSFCIWTFYMIS